MGKGRKRIRKNEFPSRVFRARDKLDEGVAPSQRKVEPPRESDVLRAENGVGA